MNATLTEEKPADRLKSTKKVGETPKNTHKQIQESMEGLRQVVQESDKQIVEEMPDIPQSKVEKKPSLIPEQIHPQPHPLNESQVLEKPRKDSPGIVVNKGSTQESNHKKTSMILELQPQQTRSDNSKGSSEHEFVDWEISNIQSGQFIFDPIDNNKKSGRKGKDSVRGQLGLPQVIAALSSGVKVKKSVSDKKKTERERANEKAKQDWSSNKQIRMVYEHFCKENHFCSIKNGLFDDKEKAKETMSLNKWMVFCKQFDIVSELLHVKEQERVQNALETATSPSHQKSTIARTKQVENTLVGIYKKAITRDHTKMEYAQFIAALQMLAYEFRGMYGEEALGLDNFVREVLFSSDEKACKQKLSNLKITFATPKISYEKVKIPSELTKSRLEKSTNKENRSQSRRPMKRDLSHATLNTVIKQARKEGESSTQGRYRLGVGAKGQKLVLQQLGKGKKGDKSRVKKEKKKNSLVQYFESTHDDLLDSYFQGETRVDEVYNFK